MNFKTILILFFISSFSFAQTVVTTAPTYPIETDNIVLTFDVTYATHANKIAGYTGDVYAHTGVTTAAGRWQHVIGSWGNNSAQPKLTRTGTNIYQLVIDNPRTYYGASSSEKITELSFVLRSSDGSKQTEDIFIQLYEHGINIVINEPDVEVKFDDPMRSPVFANSGDTLNISVSSVTVGGKTNWIYLYVDNEKKEQVNNDSITYKFIADEYSTGRHDVKIIADGESSGIDSTTFVIMKNPAVKNLPLPQGAKIGINKDSDIFALYAPKKEFVYMLNDINDWKVDTNYFMNRYEITPDSVIFWIQPPITHTDPMGYSYKYQYLVDGKIRIPDPYSETILDPWNDGYITSSTYPGLPSYPTGKTENIVTYFENLLPTYQWHVNNFQKPSKEKLVIYELLVRDFISTHNFKTLKDTLSYFKKLGINAIELMPASEFEGNSSWGYNPMMYFAVDKYYGHRDSLKAFIDACHENGIAVIMDIVLNHAYGSNPMVRMYWDETNNRPSAGNPWFNQVSPNPVFSWGNDFNHESSATKYFVDRVTSYWLTEFKFDGFRFDFTKGFTNKSGDGSAYDASRITILKRMADKIWEVDSTAYVILEHFADNYEEKILSDYGAMLWGNLNYNYNEAAMGWVSTSNFSNISYKNRTWTKPHLVGYMESHDEERLMYKNLKYGNSSGEYDIRKTNYALSRIKLAAAFFITVPGPKMIWQFGELGYDYSIDYNGRVGEKPIRWDYYTNSPQSERQKLFKVYSELIKLKTNYEAFSSSDFSMNVASTFKRISINHSSMNVNIIGNFGVTAGSMNPSFQNTGMWYDYFTGDSLNVVNAGDQINLQPGEFRIYTTVKLPTPENGKEIISDIEDEENLPTEFSLSQNYPNPFNPTTTISFTLPLSGYTTLKVYDILGREVATLVNEYQQAGQYNVEFGTQLARQGGNAELSSGIYFYKLTTGNYSAVRKMILLK
ncbi:MAG: T9SS type A sorting domain-containing protein [Ignavibacteriales bacterium]|nr:T9SS type A sorting domain-containing protein [Ignavibacteriales bacterium]